MASNGGPKTQNKIKRTQTKKAPRFAAGFLFTDGIFTIGGYQPHSHCVSGFGGKQERDETPIQTAIRETIEEMFGIAVPDAMVHEFEAILRRRGPIATRETRGYYLFVMDFRHLEILLQFVKSKGIHSPFYTTLPKDFGELFIRKMVAGAEMQGLEFLHLQTYEAAYKLYKNQRPKLHSVLGNEICDYFISDLKWVFNYFQEHPPLLAPVGAAGGK